MELPLRIARNLYSKKEVKIKLGDVYERHIMERKKKSLVRFTLDIHQVPVYQG